MIVSELIDRLQRIPGDHDCKLDVYLDFRNVYLHDRQFESTITEVSEDGYINIAIRKIED